MFGSIATLRVGDFRCIGRIAFTVAALAFATQASATFHTYKIEQLYSNADGTVQFIVLHEAARADGQEFWAGHELRSTSNAGTKTYTFPNNLPRDDTANTRVLIATEGFAALHILTPDYVIPNGFLATKAGSVNFADVDEFGYASLPTDGVMALKSNGVPVPNVATNFAGQSASVSAVAAPSNYEGLWWNSPAGSESGWGINFAHQGDIIFATWFTYGLDGKATWLSVTTSKTAAKTYTGTLYRTGGPAFNAVPFDPTKVTLTAVGNATLTFTNGNAATFAYTVDGVAQVKSITRQVFRAPGTVCQ